MIVVTPDPASNRLFPARLEPVLLTLGVLGQGTSGQVVGLFVDPLHTSTARVPDTVVSGSVQGSVSTV